MLKKILEGDMRTISRAISKIENGDKSMELVIDNLYSHCGNALVLGITGPPGAGKSVLIDKLIKEEREQGKRIAVLAVDPSSPFSGGAILGDRLRMQKHSTDSKVFIRSMASRGHIGGIAGATLDAIRVFDASGFDLIIIETIGVGQVEVEIMEISDITILVLVPGMGDEIQALKAGIMEIGDIFVVNKKDQQGANKLKSEIEYVLNFNKNTDSTEHPIIMTNAITSEGVKELIEVIHDYFYISKKNQKFIKKRIKQIKSEIKKNIIAGIINGLNNYISSEDKLNTWAEDIYYGKEKIYNLVNQQIKLFIKEIKEK